MRSTVALTVLALILPALALADYILPSEVHVNTTKYHPEETDFSEGTYYYDIAWQGIKVAQAQIEVGDESGATGPFLKVKAFAKTGRVIDVFYKLRHTSESTFHAHTLRPLKFVSHQKENKNEKFREIYFDEAGNITTKGLKNGAIEDAISFRSDNLTLDPISAAFVARSLSVNLGEKLSFDVFNGKHRYLITFKVAAREKLDLDGRQYDAFRIEPTVQKLTDSEGEKRLKSAVLWVSADSERRVLKLESSVLIGKVTAKLVRFAEKGEGQPLRAAKLNDGQVGQTKPVIR